jgi:hypothetical protein
VDSDDEERPGVEILYDSEYNTAVRMRIQQMLLMQYSATNPRTFSQETMCSQLVGPLMDHKGYIIRRALAVEQSDSRWGSVLSTLLKEVIPENTRGKGGLKQNAAKAALVDIVSKSWTAIHKIYEHEEGSFSREASHDLKMYLFTMTALESDCIAAVLEESNADVNSESLPVPLTEKDRGFDSKLQPELRFWNCARCKLKTVNYPVNYKDVQQERRRIKGEYLKLSK